MLYIMSAGKCKLKQQYTVMHLLEGPKSGTLTTSTADEDVEQQVIHC